MFNTDNKLTILAIGAHGDDIELACGGSLAKAVSNGHQVVMVIVTGTDSKDHKNISIRGNGSAEKEAKAAAKIIGVSKLIILGYEDTLVPYSAELIGKLDDIMNQYNPDIVFTHFVFDTHQDHIRTAHSTISAARRQNTILLYEPINPSGQGYIAFRPQVYIDISQTIKKKIDALKAHQSQYEKYNDIWIDGVTARSKFRGFEMGTEYAECFEVVRAELIL
jgi:LmbE family N-acetylglucosaminyl deacetylase